MFATAKIQFFLKTIPKEAVHSSEQGCPIFQIHITILLRNRIVTGFVLWHGRKEINSKSGVQGDPTHYQISAHIDHGNSGGPMFNSKGTIIGITDSGLNKAEYGDVNYAIKSSYLKSLVDALPVKLDLPHDTSIEKLSRVEQIKVLSKYTALILIDLP